MKKICYKLTTGVIIASALFFAACTEPENFEEKKYRITDITADGSPATSMTTKLFITFDKDIPNLTADDLKINSSFSLIKGGLTKTGGKTYELELTSGRTDTIRVGLDPYRGFTGWSAKTVQVVAGFYFDGTRELTILGYGLSNIPIVITIPDNITGVPVTAIGNNSFQHRHLTGVIIPDSVTSIGNNAFKDNLLSEIDINGNVKSIGDNAFANNKLESVTIPQSVRTIGNGAFENNKITGIKIYISITSIGSNAFANNEITGGITIPDYPGINLDIGTGAFMNNKMKRVEIACEYITVVKNSTFMNNELETVILGNKIKKVEAFAFWGNKITSITIGENVTLEPASFGDNFERAYDNNEKASGTYTRNINSTEWNLTATDEDEDEIEPGIEP